MTLQRSKSKLAGIALLSALTAVPMGAGVAYLARPADAQTAADPASPPPPPPGGDQWPGAAGRHHPGPGMYGMHDGRGMGPDGDRFARMGRHHRHHRDGNMQMRLAGKLAAAETALGIRSDQLDAWRDFTSKLIAFATPPWQRDRGAAADRAASGDIQMKAGNAKGDATPPDVPPAGADGKSFGMLDRMLDGAIQRGEDAKALKASLQKLESVLTPEQVQMAHTLMRSEARMGGRHHGWRGGGYHGRHGDHMWRGRHGGQGWGGNDRGGPGNGPDDGQD